MTSTGEKGQEHAIEFSGHFIVRRWWTWIDWRRHSRRSRHFHVWRFDLLRALEWQTSRHTDKQTNKFVFEKPYTNSMWQVNLRTSLLLKSIRFKNLINWSFGYRVINLNRKKVLSYCASHLHFHDLKLNFFFSTLFEIFLCQNFISIG